MQLSRFSTGTYNSKDVKTQISAGWFDWFCRETSLAGKTPSLYRVLQRISTSPRLNLATMYAFFKNNCPAVGSLYDSISICDLATGDVLFWIAPSVGYGPDKGKAQVFSVKESTDAPAASGRLKDVVNWFVPAKSVAATLRPKMPADPFAAMKKVYNEAGIDLHDVPPGMQSGVNKLVKEVIRLRTQVAGR
ncbi:MAG TPA: hypothetical protein DGH68_01775 [Bacteroidetes bacterium]|nr:hypothetical protein [Bacteroidota bacterium]